ncbi:MAG: thioesterase domain-containing protein, partial [Pseudomonadota bacterium]
EVYQTLANILSDDHNCYGIDNYNMYHQKKITDLSQLASYYLKAMRTCSNFDSKNIMLLGWSLGGQIALEVAAQLEALAYRNIKIYLLDTAIADDKIKKYRAQSDSGKLKNETKKRLTQLGFSKSYINKALSALLAAEKISNTAVSKKLEFSQVALFKATQVDQASSSSIDHHLTNYIISLKYNNINQISKKKIKCIQLPCHHANILDYLDMIVEEFDKF